MSNEGFALKEKVESLRVAILEKHPRLPTLLSEIHKTLLAQPEQVTLMNEEELTIVVSGLMKQSGVEFAKAAMTGKTGSTKSLAAKLKSGELEI